MGALASYTLNYTPIGVPGDPLVDVKIYIKANADPNYTLAFTNVGAAPGTTYTYTFNNLDSHTVHQVKMESVCPSGVTLFGDIAYLSNAECQTITATPNAGTLDVDWDCFTPVNGDSVIEYRLEYRDVTSSGPYFIETIPIANVLAYWTTNPGTYPNFSYNISTGISPGNQYQIFLYTTMEFDYLVFPSTVTQVQIPVICRITSPVV